MHPIYTLFLLHYSTCSSQVQFSSNIISKNSVWITRNILSANVKFTRNEGDIAVGYLHYNHIIIPGGTDFKVSKRILDFF